MNEPELNKALELMKISKKVWDKTSENDRRTAFRHKWLNASRIHHPDKNPSQLDEANINIRLLNEFNQEYLSSQNLKSSSSEPNLTQPATTDNVRRSATERDFNFRRSTPELDLKTVLTEDLRAKEWNDFKQHYYSPRWQLERESLDLAMLTRNLNNIGLCCLASVIVTPNIYQRLGDPQYLKLLNFLLNQIELTPDPIDKSRFCHVANELIKHCSAYKEKLKGAPATDVHQLSEYIQHLREKHARMIAAEQNLFNVGRHSTFSDLKVILAADLRAKKWGTFKEHFCSPQGAFQIESLDFTTIDETDLYCFATVIAGPYWNVDLRDPIFLKLLNCLLNKIKLTFDSIDNDKFSNVTGLGELITHCTSYGEKVTEASETDLREFNENLQRLREKYTLLFNSRKESILSAYKAIYKALQEGDGLLHGAALLAQAVNRASSAFFSTSQDNIPNQLTYPWDNKSADETFSAILNCDSDQSLSLLEKKAAALSVALVDNHINKNLLLTMIYVDKCPIKNYLGIKPDTGITPYEEDGGYHLVNAYISFNISLLTEAKHAPFHQRGELAIQHRNFHERYYGQYKGQEVLLNNEHAFPVGSLPARIQQRLKEYSPVWQESSAPSSYPKN